MKAELLAPVMLFLFISYAFHKLEDDFSVKKEIIGKYLRSDTVTAKFRKWKVNRAHLLACSLFTSLFHAHFSIAESVNRC